MMSASTVLVPVETLRTGTSTTASFPGLSEETTWRSSMSETSSLRSSISTPRTSSFGRPLATVSERSVLPERLTSSAESDVAGWD